MNNFLNTIILISITASIISIFIFFIKFMLKEKISKTFHYYIWILILIRLLIPFSLKIEFPKKINQIIYLSNLNNLLYNSNFEDEDLNIDNTIKNDFKNKNDKAYFFYTYLFICSIFFLIEF